MIIGGRRGTYGTRGRTRRRHGARDDIVFRGTGVRRYYSHPNRRRARANWGRLRRGARANVRRRQQSAFAGTDYARRFPRDLMRKIFKY